MSAIIMDGRKVAEAIYFDIPIFTDPLPMDVVPTLVVISVGNDEASKIYVRNKEKACARFGFSFLHFVLPADCTQEDLNTLIRKFNADSNVHGIILQLPIPVHLDADEALEQIHPAKDVDGLGLTNTGYLAQNGYPDNFPCTALGVYKILLYYDIPLDGAHVVIVGRSKLVGKPLMHMMLNENATVTVCHSHTKDLAAITRTADVLIVAAGSPKLITADMVQPGSVVIDVGINRVGGKVCGDVDFEHVKEVAGHITPVPGGVGPTTVASLIYNTAASCSWFNANCGGV